ncbi:MAG: phosphatase PAP2 family protein [Pseudomonadota bacterium]
MSTESTEHALPHSPAEAVEAVREEARFGVAFLRLHGRRLLLVFAGVLLPLWGFRELAEDLRAGQVFPFDEPLLRWANALARDGWDVFFVRLSDLGYLYGLVPANILLVGTLALRRNLREGLFAGVSIIGSALLNLGAKHLFARQRPTLWESIAPETTFSFPSGHAMGTMTLAAVLILLAWRTPWRWPVMVLMAGFAGLVGLSRIYLGVHYPSDILAGWAAALVWTVGTYSVVFHRRRPWVD